MDSIRNSTDSILSTIRRKIRRDYDEMGNEITVAMQDYLKDYEDNVPESAFQGSKWKRFVDSIVNKIVSFNQKQTNNVTNKVEEVYNMAADGAKPISLLPHPIIDKQKDVTWNKQKIESIVRSSIGKPPDKIADQMHSIADMNSNVMTRKAKSTINGAENAGRLDVMMSRGGYKKWLTVQDERVRDSHAAIHGQIVPVDKPFGNGLMFPGDPSGSPAEVYNCRCSIVWVDTGSEDQLQVGVIQDGVPMLDELDQHTSDYLREHADDIGLTAEQQEELNSMVQKMYDQSEVYSYISMDALEDLSNGGHMMNAFELAESRTAGKVSGGVTMSEEYSSARNTVSMKLFGKDASIMSSADMEKYGFLGSSDFDKVLLSENKASNCGNVCIRLDKSSMKDRVTYTFGDSLNEIGDGKTLSAGGFDSHASIAGIPVDNMASSYKKMKTLEKKTGSLDASDVTTKCVGRKGYIETQLHGTITVNDISEVVIKYMWNGKEYIPMGDNLDAVESLVDRLQSMGIPTSRVSNRMLKDPETGEWVEKVVRIHDRHSIEG